LLALFVLALYVCVIVHPKFTTMKIKFALSKIAQGVFNCDTAMEYLAKDVNVTEELYEDLKKAEQAYLSASRWPIQDTIVGVLGFNGNPDFKANFRGRIDCGRCVVVMCSNGMQLEVALSDLYIV
jgi:hypothetical protein